MCRVFFPDTGSLSGSTHLSGSVFPADSKLRGTSRRPNSGNYRNAKNSRDAFGELSRVFALGSDRNEILFRGSGNERKPQSSRFIMHALIYAEYYILHFCASNSFGSFRKSSGFAAITRTTPEPSGAKIPYGPAEQLRASTRLRPLPPPVPLKKELRLGTGAPPGPGALKF